MAKRPPKIERLLPADREAWFKLRDSDITASVVGALFGAHEWMTYADLWAQKTGRVKREEGETPAQRRGRLLEDDALQILAEERPDWKIEHNAQHVYYREPASRLGATPDAIVEAPGRGRGIVQIKSVSRSAFKHGWHSEDGAIDVPLWIALQATLEAHLANASWAAVGALLFDSFGGLSLELVEIELMPGVIDAMRAKSAEFWALIKKGKEPAFDFKRDGDLIRTLYADAQNLKTVDLSTDNRMPTLLAERAAAKAQEKAAKEAIEAIDAEIKSKLGEAEVGLLGDGKQVTWKLQTRNGYTVAPTAFRVLKCPTVALAKE